MTLRDRVLDAMAVAGLERGQLCGSGDWEHLSDAWPEVCFEVETPEGLVKVTVPKHATTYEMAVCIRAALEKG